MATTAPTRTTEPPPQTGPREGPTESTRVVPPHRIGQKLAVELIGTFFLVFTAGATVYGGSPLPPLAVARCTAS